MAGRGIALVLLGLLAIMSAGCQGTTKRTIAFHGLSTPDILDSLEPSLVPEMESTWFVALAEYDAPNQLLPGEQFALAEQVLLPAGPMFQPDERGRRQIAAQLFHLSRTLRGTLTVWFRRSEQYLPLIKKEFQRAGLPEPLIYLPFIESGYSPRALSSAGARGIWQFMPATGRRFGLEQTAEMDDRCHPMRSTRAAIAYLRELHGKFRDWSLALAAYNCGEGKIAGAVRATGARTFFELVHKNDTLPEKYRLAQETLAYVPRFIAMVQIVQHMELLGFTRPNWELPPTLSASAR